MVKKIMCLSMVLGLLALMSIGCGSSMKNTSDMTTSIGQTMDKAESSIEENATSDTLGREDGFEINTDMGLNRKIIKTGYLDVETKNFDQSVEAIMNEVSRLNGFVQGYNVYGDATYHGRNGEIMIRIPSDQFDGFMNHTQAFGNLLSKRMNGDDVTEQYADIELRLGTLEIQHERLETLLKQAGELKDLFAIEQELANVTYEIESLKGSLKKYDSLVDFSSITINLQETIEYQEVTPTPVTLGQKIKNEFKYSVKGVGRFLEGLLLFVIALIPNLIIIVPVGLLIWWIVKRIIRYHQSKQNK